MVGPNPLLCHGRNAYLIIFTRLSSDSFYILHTWEFACFLSRGTLVEKHRASHRQAKNMCLFFVSCPVMTRTTAPCFSNLFRGTFALLVSSEPSQSLYGPFCATSVFPCSPCGAWRHPCPGTPFGRHRMVPS